MSHDMTAISRQLRAAGYRVTPQRQMILDAVCALGAHVTPDEVYTRVHRTAPTLNRATVYRALHFLTEQGILTATLRPDGRLGYEIAGPEPHHHLVCRACAATVDLPHSALGDFYQAMDAQYGFLIETEHISFFGLCAACREGDKVTG